METAQIHSPLPKSKITDWLVSKSNTRNNYKFDYISRLNELRQRVSLEVSQMPVLFPEYTPHNGQYHLERLFHIADSFLGDDLIEQMNATELFLLAISLYGHDWRMAVSENEKEAIITGCNSNPDIHLLDDEKKKFDQFCKDRNVVVDKPIAIEDWREYVRQTHAWRSGKRMQVFFEKEGGGISEHASNVCVGHWLDFGSIDNDLSYPTDAGILGEEVNVKAITLYVRLIDLLDLGDDRTPYVLWKFVAPRNKFSKMEWLKHRALRAVTFPEYLRGRYIRIDGSTDDHNVYMSIMDLKRYVDDQFRQSCDLLNRMKHKYHRLNISHPDWHITAKGFEPVPVQFEFDRLRMFDILGDEIYQGNPFVFIRELLQNAIDAIDMRQELLDRKGMSINGKINIQVTEDADHYIVEVRDNGIGMDDYVIRNYLAVAGKSYYRSKDFHKEGLRMDPISRFGIGTLSCFMVADHVEVETFKDPHTTSKQASFFITIPAKENYFKISKNVRDIAVGTTFRVYVIKNRLPQHGENNTAIDFNVTDYVKRIAGFVKHPIQIVETGITTIVKHPDSTIEDETKEYCIDFSFPIHKAFLPQHVETVKELFVEKRLSLKEDLQMADYDGCLTFLVLKNKDMDLVSYGTHEAVIVHMEEVEGRRIEWDTTWNSFTRNFRQSHNKLNIPDGNFHIFLNGILLTDTFPPHILINDTRKNDKWGFRSFVSPQLIVNIPKPADLKMDLARKNIITKERWDMPIWEAYYQYLRNNEIKEILLLDLKDRLIAMGSLMTFYQITAFSLLNDLIDCSEFPLVFIKANGSIAFEKFDDKNHETIRLTPYNFEDFFISHYNSTETYSAIINNWSGEDAVMNINTLSYKNVNISLENASILINCFIDIKYYLSGIIFISSPLGYKYPLVQEVLKLKPGKPDIQDLNLKDIDWEHIDAYDLYLLYLYIQDEFYNCPKIVKFPALYTHKLFYGFEYINCDSDYIQELIQLMLNFLSAKKNKSLREDISGMIGDLFRDTPFWGYRGGNFDLSVLNNKINHLFSEAIKHHIIECDRRDKKQISIDDFVEGSITINGDCHIKPGVDIKFYLEEENQQWGEPIV